MNLYEVAPGEDEENHLKEESVDYISKTPMALPYHLYCTTL